MRTDREMLADIKETVYYYLLSDIVESHKADDKDALDLALKIAVENYDNPELIERIKQRMDEAIEDIETDDDYQDYLFVTTEEELY